MTFDNKELSVSVLRKPRSLFSLAIGLVIRGALAEWIDGDGSCKWMHGKHIRESDTIKPHVVTDLV